MVVETGGIEPPSEALQASAIPAQLCFREIQKKARSFQPGFTLYKILGKRLHAYPDGKNFS